jgi:Tfp pilus assembly PilM family ATPase
MWEQVARFFPPPSWLAMSPVGVEFSDRAIRALALRGVPGDLRVAWWAEELLSEGVIVGGVVRREEVVVEALAKIRSAHPFRFAAVAVPERISYLFDARVAATDLVAARAELEARIEEFVPLRAADAVCDLIPFPTEGAEEKFLGAAVPRTAVTGYLAVCERVGIVPLAFDVDPAAACRAAVGVGNRHALVVVNISEDDTGVAVAVSGFPRFASSLALTAADAFQEISHAVEALAAEFVRIKAFWESRENKPLQAAVLCGAGANERMAALLARTVGMPVEEADVWQNVCPLERRIPPLARAEALRFAVPIGAALRHYSLI